MVAGELTTAKKASQARIGEAAEASRFERMGTAAAFILEGRGEGWRRREGMGLGLGFRSIL